MESLDYQAFVSYSHEPDGRLAGALQSSLQRFAAPWYRLRTMRIFLDKVSLSANPALWQSIEEALGQSHYLLLLASTASAQSHWVRQEVQWWLQHRSADKLLICLTDGVIVWDDKAGDFDWEKTTAIPSCLKGVYSAVPLYADFRAAKANGKLVNSDPAYRDALLDVAAPLLNRPKDELDGEDIRLHRNAKRAAWALAVFIAALVLTAGVVTNLAHQRKKTAGSRALASEAASHTDDRTLAMLLSIEARRTADTVESRRALLTSIQRVPNALAFLWGHTDSVTKAVFSPDGKTILSAGWDNRILMWDPSTRQLLGQPISTGRDLVSVAFNPDGSRFAASSGGSITIWETKSRQLVGEPFKANEDFVRVGFSSHGTLIAAASTAYGAHPSHVFMWDVASHKPIGDPIEGSDFAFSPDDALLAIASYHDVVLYDLRAHRVIGRPLTGETKNISSIAFSPHGGMVAAGSEDKTIGLWDVRKGTHLGTFTGHTDTVTSLVFSPDGKILLSGSQDGTIMTWKVEDLQLVDTPVKGFGASISSIYIDPDGNVRSLALDKQSVIMLNVSDDPPLARRIAAPDISSANIAFSPDGHFLASGDGFGDISLWDVDKLELSGEPLSGHSRQVTSLAYAPNGKILVSGSIDGTIIFWDVATRKALGPAVQAYHRPVWSLTCSPDGSMVAAGSDGELAFWSLATRQQMGPTITSQKDRIWNLAFSPDGKFLAAAGNTEVVAIWKIGQLDSPARTIGSPLSREEMEITPVAATFNQDGTVLATSTEGHSVTMWNFSNGKPLPPALYGHTAAVSGLAFRQDGKVLASGSADGSIRLWDVQAHELIGAFNPLKSDTNQTNHIVFAPNAGILASPGEDESILLWDVDFEDWTHLACRIANRNLTAKEWSIYFGSSRYQKTCGDI